jgi:hypothetical protein
VNGTPGIAGAGTALLPLTVPNAEAGRHPQCGQNAERERVGFREALEKIQAVLRDLLT